MTAEKNQPEATLALAAELRAVTARLRRRLREQAHLGEITGTQMAVLGRLEREGPATVTVLAKAEAMRPQSMGANMAALEAAGLAAGAPDPGDGRQTLWSVTPAFLARIKANRAAREDWLCHALEKALSPSEQAELARAIRLLDRLVDT